jgi:hypothetical protein
VGATEIEQVLRDDAEKPDAWEDPIRVPRSASERPAWYRRSKHLELSAKFYVLSVLHRLGSEATLTLAEPTDIDIAALLPSGEALTIEVRALVGSRDWAVDRFRVRKDHFVAFVCFDALRAVESVLQPSLYIWSSEHLRAAVSDLATKSVSLELLAARHSATEALKAFVADSPG